ncbi:MULTISPECIES: hypothetical protein [Rhizobium/Agrobacterium group]|uniref:Uncharacterized protein n=1 Tax=Agrobacterium vitis TaxID=373 RepID=A0ABD6HAL8_AGRVI|nr:MULTISPECIES: hypothetical protein [Rhizobium/Agrobacterium group]MUO30641.1 hypothetical protein [Agrobacterium vitis]MUO43618.1 hypothetical protein [Agrobacterium vitis]MUP11426.1 hypothetical protein [Agrobacterium vitis]
MANQQSGSLAWWRWLIVSVDSFFAKTTFVDLKIEQPLARKRGGITTFIRPDLRRGQRASPSIVFSVADGFNIQTWWWGNLKELLINLAVASNLCALLPAPKARLVTALANAQFFGCFRGILAD